MVRKRQSRQQRKKKTHKADPNSADKAKDAVQKEWSKAEQSFIKDLALKSKKHKNKLSKRSEETKLQSVQPADQRPKRNQPNVPVRKITQEQLDRIHAIDAFQLGDFDLATRYFERSLANKPGILGHSASLVTVIPQATATPIKAQPGSQDKDSEDSGLNVPTSNGVTEHSEETPPDESAEKSSSESAEKSSSESAEKSPSEEPNQEPEIIKTLPTSDESSVTLGREKPTTSPTKEVKLVESYVPVITPHDLQACQQLVMSRLMGDNSVENLQKAVLELRNLIHICPKDITLRVALCDAQTRLLDFEAVGKSLKEAVCVDQLEQLDALPQFFDTLVENTSKSVYGSLLSTEQVAKKYDYPAPLENLKAHFLSLLHPSRQACFTTEFSKIHDEIDSDMVTDILGHDCKNCRNFLHSALDWNINREKEHLALFFLRQELAFKATTYIWRKFPAKSKIKLPESIVEETKSETLDTKTNFDADSATDAQTESGSNTTENTIKNTTENVIKNTTKNATEKPTKTSTEKPIENSTEKPIEISTENPIEISTENPIEISTENPIEISTENPIEISTESAEKSPKSESAQPKEEQLPFFTELDVFCSRDGIEFIASCGIDGIKHLSSAIDIHHNKHADPSVMLTLNYLTDVGVNLVDFLSEYAEDGTTHMCDGGPADSLKEDWPRFIGSRFHAHEVLDIQAAKHFQPPTGASKPGSDPDVFERKLTDILGRDVQKRLTAKEIEVSLPVLRKYAELMSHISGIPIKYLLLELVDQESAELANIPIIAEFEDEKELDDKKETKSDNDSAEPSTTSTSSSLCQQSLRHSHAPPKPGEPYEPMGLAALIQTHEFKVTKDPTFGNYDPKKVMLTLKNLEKDVVQMQIDYKKEVEAAAGNKFVQLQDVIAHLQVRGLELTRWLRGFVKYMIDRRAVEQELVDQSGAEDTNTAIVWFEKMQNRLTTSQNVLLSLIARIFLKKLQYSFEKKQNDEPLTDGATGRFEKNQKLKHAQHIVNFLNPLLQDLRRKKLVKRRVFEEVNHTLQATIATNSELRNKRDELIKSLDVSKLTIPFLSIPVPNQIIYTFQNLHAKDVRVKQYLAHKQYGHALTELSILTDRTSWSDEVICFLIHSTLDNTMVAFPSVIGSGSSVTSALGGVFPRCIACNKAYGILVCKQCGVSRYCGKLCQTDHWNEHSNFCKLWAAYAIRQQTLVL